VNSCRINRTSIREVGYHDAKLTTAYFKYTLISFGLVVLRIQLACSITLNIHCREIVKHSAGTVVLGRAIQTIEICAR
jgi:hypothetical protein